jgi:hypothetical protein
MEYTGEKMKVVSMYLPQFHRIKENDEWWGEGYTEWTAVKNAPKQFEGHEQPVVPLDNNYYDLLKHDTMSWQADLMHKYGVDAQCIYHYWFKDGRKILEKPAENLLKWTDIDMQFCFCWANETWARSWSNVKDKNSWNDSCEKIKAEDESGILLEQSYGGEKEWIEHFYYFLTFFKDKRYIIIDNMPVLMIYKPDQIECLSEMLNLWNRLAVENGFNGVFLIGANPDKETTSILNKVLYMEPQYITSLYRARNGYHAGSLIIHDYDELWNGILEYQDKQDNVLYCGFVGYDDTPRRGKKGELVKNRTADSFKFYLAKLLAKNYVKGNDIVFLNAWNEWGEGMHLEPDNKEKYGYLEAVAYAKEHYEQYINYFKNKEMTECDSYTQMLIRQNEKNRMYWEMLNRWLCLKEKRIFFDEYFLKRNIKKIAIYGMGIFGKHLYEELRGSTIEIAYGIDQQGSSICRELPIYTVEDDLPRVDAVVISVMYSYDEMIENIKKHNINIFLLKNIINELDDT